MSPEAKTNRGVSASPPAGPGLKADLDGAILTYDCRMQLAQVMTCARLSQGLKHVSKSYNFFRVVCDSFGEVVRLIYTKQSASYG